MMCEEFKYLKGQTITGIEHDKEEFIMTLDNGQRFKLYHAQECCETVELVEIIGDLKDIIGSPLTLCEEITEVGALNGYESLNGYEHYTWTFYKLATTKGYVTLRWCGESSGFYSERVNFMEIS